MKPMLASATDGKHLKWPKLASPKLDGVRCIIVDGKALSRSMKPIPNKYVQMLFGLQELNGLDGELIVGDPLSPTVFSATTSAVMSHDGIPSVWFHVFDDATETGGFQRRLHTAHRRAKKRSSSCIAVHHAELTTPDGLLDYEDQCLSSGYEGVMLRDPAGPYKYGRSTVKEEWLLKLKRFTDAEAEIIGFIELSRNNNEAKLNELGALSRGHRKEGMIGAGVLGAFTVRDIVTGVEFDIGTGFTARDRAVMWKEQKSLVGRLVKYKSQPTGVKDKPRFPVFLGFRHPSDM